MSTGIIGYRVNFVGKDGSKCHIVLDANLYGGRVLSRGQAVSNALHAIFEAKGVDYIDSYNVKELLSPHSE